jgi:hypothetical protein
MPNMNSISSPAAPVLSLTFLPPAMCLPFSFHPFCQTLLYQQPLQTSCPVRSMFNHSSACCVCCLADTLWDFTLSSAAWVPECIARFINHLTSFSVRMHRSCKHVQYRCGGSGSGSCVSVYFVHRSINDLCFRSAWLFISHKDKL